MDTLVEMHNLIRNRRRRSGDIEQILAEDMDRLICAAQGDDFVPIWLKPNLTLEEASKYYNIGRNRLRDLTEDENCDFVLYVGNKRLIKRKQFDAFISQQYSI